MGGHTRSFFEIKTPIPSFLNALGWVRMGVTKSFVLNFGHERHAFGTTTVDVHSDLVL
jgi:hypothetical protein